MFFKKRKHTREQGRTIDSQIIVVWGAGGNNTAAFSLKLAEELSQLARVILVELPCLGIPRLSFALEKWDHEQTIETVLTKYWFNGTIMGKGFYEHTPNLALLPISPFAQPDNPLVNRVGLEVLKNFPGHFANSVWKKGWEIVLFICQGQLIHPLTFFALQSAQQVFLPVNDPSTIAYSTLNIKKLQDVFRFPIQKFKVIAPQHNELIKEVMGEKIMVCRENYRELALSCLPEVKKAI